MLALAGGAQVVVVLTVSADLPDVLHLVVVLSVIVVHP